MSNESRKDRERHVSMKADMRRLMDREPEAFRAVMDDLVRAGSHWEKQLPPFKGKANKPIQVDKKTLALLRADCLNAERAGYSQEEFLARLAEKGCRYGHEYFDGTWRNADAIRPHLRKSGKLAKSDETFLAEVEYYRKVLLEIGASSAAWPRRVKGRSGKA